MNGTRYRRWVATWVALLLAGAALAAPADDSLYEQALDRLDDRQYQQAYDTFERYIDGGGARVDAALYWQARAMYKLGRTDRAIARLNRLKTEYPRSEWLDDAEAMRVELRGDSVDPEQLDGAELKILALQSVMRQDPERALDAVRRMIEGTGSESVRDQAMFVLAQAGTPSARQVLADYARDASRPEIARSAVRHIAIFGGSESRGMLRELYDRSTDPRMREAIMDMFLINHDTTKLAEIARSDADVGMREHAIRLLGATGASSELEALYTRDALPRVREAVLNAYMVSGQTDRLLEAARNDPSPAMREQAISLLGASGAAGELDQLYRAEQDPAVRRMLVSGFMVSGDSERLLRVAREDGDPEVRREAIQMLGVMGADEELARLRRDNPSREVMQAVSTALYIRGDARGLIEIYRASDDPEVRSLAAQHLSVMDSEEALQFMLRVLEEED